MSIPDDWQPPLCKHSAQPIVEQHFMDWDFGTYIGLVPTARTLWYECPTPLECVREQYRLADSPPDFSNWDISHHVPPL